MQDELILNLLFFIFSEFIFLLLLKILH